MNDLPPIQTRTGHRPGPVVALLGGVHGDELEGVLAVRGVLAGLNADGLGGSIRWAAPAHPAAWRADSRTGPADGKNLARVFPGDPSGSPTEQVAAHLTENLIAGADLLIDLHSAGKGYDMPLLVGYHSAGPLAERAAAAAAAFAAPLVWQHPAASTGRSLSAAEDLGVPAIYVEGRGGGRLRQRDLDGYHGGVLRVLVHLGMVTAARAGVDAAGPVTVVAGDGNTDEGITAAADGYFVAAVEAADRVEAGQPLGRILTEQAEVAAEIRSPQAGRVMLLRRHARVAHGDTIAIVAADADGSTAGWTSGGTSGGTDGWRTSRQQGGSA